MFWGIANKAVLWLPSLPGAYFVGLNFLAAAASSNDQAKALLALQVEIMTEVLTNPWSLACLALVFLVWLALIGLTTWGANKAQSREEALNVLAQRLDECAQSIIRLTTLHSHRPLITHGPERHREMVDNLMRSNHTLMSDYEVLYSTQALNLFNEAIARKVEVDEAERITIEHPTNPIGVGEVAQQLALIAARIRGKW